MWQLATCRGDRLNPGQTLGELRHLPDGTSHLSAFIFPKLKIKRFRFFVSPSLLGKDSKTTKTANYPLLVDRQFNPPTGPLTTLVKEHKKNTNFGFVLTNNIGNIGIYE